MAEEQMYSSLKSIFKKKERKVKVQTRNPAREQQALSKHETQEHMATTWDFILWVQEMKSQFLGERVEPEARYAFFHCVYLFP